MRIPGFERGLQAPETLGDRIVPQLESFCARECRADSDFHYEHHSPEWFENYDSCMEMCH